jgi:hypothetical protein
MAGLLLEVAYTRIVSYKLWYYYTYLVIGLALLGIGSGGVLVAVVAPIRRWSTERIIAVCSLLGALTIGAGYLVIADIRINTTLIWHYGTRASYSNLGALGIICFTLFATFVALGVIVSVLLGRAGDGVGRLYFADLLGAGLGCLLAIPLIVSLGPPRLVALAGLLVAGVALLFLRVRSFAFGFGAVTVLVLALAVGAQGLLPDIHPEDVKLDGRNAPYSAWGPVFRVDVFHFSPTEPNQLLSHDGTYGSGIWKWDGNVNSLGRFDSDPRSIPFKVLGTPPGRELIIGSAGGNEILASLYFHAPKIEAVELNPVTVSLLRHRYADWTGHLADHPGVDLHQGDGRSYLARSNRSYDLVWYVAPDSYAATNAASSGAMVLSESYLYTRQMIGEAFDHLSNDGIMVAQFGELDFTHSPNRTSRYIVTARDALRRAGVADPSSHLLVAAQLTKNGDFSTIAVKRTPFTPTEVDAFLHTVQSLPDQVAIYAPGHDLGNHIVTNLAGGTNEEVAKIVADRSQDISSVSDDSPFFWHFTPFRQVARHIFQSADPLDPENGIGERVLLLLLGLAIAYAAVFLLLPFFFVRRQWAALPAKRFSAVYFAALGLGFMFYEITMIQRLTLFLGYPTYSLTVTLASILLSTGVGALLSQRVAGSGARVMAVLIGVLAVLTVFYRFALDDVTDALLSRSFAVRVIVALLALVPLGLCLGMFMPLGLRQVAAMTEHGDQYVAWSWAVNGFFSVIGSVLTTILSMTFGFRAVQTAALVIYVIAGLAYLRLSRLAPEAPADLEVDRTLVPA